MRQATHTKQAPTALAIRYKAVDRDPVLAEFEMVKKATGMSDAEICRRSGVTASCLRNWRSTGKTRRPQHLTLVFAFRAMGYRFGLQRIS